MTNGVDKFQCWSTLAYGYQLSGGDPVFLDRALEMSGAKDLKNYLQKSNFKNIENQAALLAIVQMLP